MAGVAVAVALLIGALGVAVSGNLSTGGWIGQGSESALVAERLERDYGGGAATLAAVFIGSAGSDARAAELVAEGRSLPVEASRELARGVATIG